MPGAPMAPTGRCSMYRRDPVSGGSARSFASGALSQRYRRSVGVGCQIVHTNLEGVELKEVSPGRVETEGLEGVGILLFPEERVQEWNVGVLGVLEQQDPRLLLRDVPQFQGSQGWGRICPVDRS